MAATPNLALLILGHTAYGTGVGLAMHAAPAYIAETVPPQVRGLFISLKVGLPGNARAFAGMQYYGKL